MEAAAMVVTESPLFKQQVLMMGSAYGGPSFWYEILREDLNPESIRRSLLFLGCLGGHGCEAAIRSKLHYPDSRVRGWACFAAGELLDYGAQETLRSLTTDSSARVRRQARSALSRLDPGRAQARARTHPPSQDVVILVSDDSARMQDQLGDALRSRGYELTFASSEIETYEMASRLWPWAVVTDNQKGRDNLSGLRMTERLASTPAHEETLLFMISADPVEGAFLWHGGDFFLPKGLPSLGSLVSTVEDYLLL
jgi:CheY-like chemotaxis protein